MEQGTCSIARTIWVKDGINLNIVRIYMILETMLVNNVTYSASIVSERLGPNNRTLGNSINQVFITREIPINGDM